MKKILFLLTFAAGISATAQVKVGTNPTTLATNANFQVEGTTSNDQFVVLKNGSVGIGTTTPSQKLTVTGGNIRIESSQSSGGTFGQLDFFNTAGFSTSPRAIISGYRTGTGDHGILDFAVASTTNAVPAVAMTIIQSGNLGIGTTTPSAKLEVAGQVKITGGTPGAGKVLTSDAAGLATWQTVSGTGTVTSVTGTAPISVATGTSTPAISIATANTTTSGALSSTDWNTFNNKQASISATAPITLTGTAVGIATASTTASGALSSADWNTFNNKTGSSNNGLTTTAGNVQLGGGLIQATAISGLTATNKISFTGTGVDNFNIDTNTLSIDGTNNRVGIGTAAPTEKLSIFGAGTATPIAFSMSNSVASFRIGLSGATGHYGTIKAGDVVFQNTLAHGIGFMTNGTTFSSIRMYISENGNVGIGATNPTAQLHTTGSVLFAGAGTPGLGKVLTSDATGNATWQTATEGTVTAVTGSAPISVATGTSTPAISIATADATTTGALSSTDWNTFNNKTGSSNNGLTTTAGNVQLGGTLIQATAISGLTATNKISFTGTGVDNFNIDTNTLSIDGTNNRVGIGTASPTEKIDVTGNVKFSGALMPNNTPGTAGQVLTSAGAGVAPTWKTIAEEPWYSVTTNAGATSNTDDIYTMGKVGIGSASLLTSTLDVNGSLSLPYKRVTANYTLSITDFVVYVDAAVTLTFPSSAGCPGRVYIIVNSTNSTITTSQHYGISGALTTGIAQNSSITIQSDGSGWRKIQ